jgi:hypothetical protein
MTLSGTAHSVEPRIVLIKHYIKGHLFDLDVFIVYIFDQDERY